jgi:hypothetical protein
MTQPELITRIPGRDDFHGVPDQFSLMAVGELTKKDSIERSASKVLECK